MRHSLKGWKRCRHLVICNVFMLLVFCFLSPTIQAHAALVVPAGSLSSARGDHTATLLPNGKVLVVGGWTGTSCLASTEIYNPETDTWSSAGNLAAARSSHTATLLPNGKVLVIGGFGPGYLASTELYDPATGKWSSAGNLAIGRDAHTATLLQNGKVLVVGGYGSPVISLRPKSMTPPPILGRQRETSFIPVPDISPHYYPTAKCLWPVETQPWAKHTTLPPTPGKSRELSLNTSDQGHCCRTARFLRWIHPDITRVP